MNTKTIQNEFDTIQKKISTIRGKQLIKNMRNELEIQSFLKMIRERPTMNYAYDFLQRLLDVNDPELKPIEKDVVDHLDLLKTIKIDMNYYWRQNASFRYLINEALIGNKNKVGFCKLKKDWKLLRRYVNDISLYDEDLIREFVIVECLFRILKFYHEKNDDNFMERNKLNINQLVSNFEICNLVEKDTLVIKMFTIFLSDKPYLSKRQYETNYLDENKYTCLKKIKADNGSAQFSKSVEFSRNVEPVINSQINNRKNSRGLAGNNTLSKKTQYFKSPATNFQNNDSSAITDETSHINDTKQNNSTNEESLNSNNNKKSIEHPLSHIASCLFESRDNIPQNPKLKMKALFSNFVNKDNKFSKSGFQHKHMPVSQDQETVSERESLSVRSFGQDTELSFNSDNQNYYEDTNLVKEGERFTTRAIIQDALHNYTFEEKEQLSKYIEMEIFSTYYNDSFSYFDLAEKIKSSLQVTSQTKHIWKSCTKTVLDIEKLKIYSSMNVKEIMIEDNKFEDLKQNKEIQTEFIEAESKRFVDKEVNTDFDFKNYMLLDKNHFNYVESLKNFRVFNIVREDFDCKKSNVVTLPERKITLLGALQDKSKSANKKYESDKLSFLDDKLEQNHYNNEEVYYENFNSKKKAVIFTPNEKGFIRDPLVRMQEYFKSEVLKNNDTVGTNLQEYKPDSITKPYLYNSAGKICGQNNSNKPENNDINQKYSYIESQSNEKLHKLCQNCKKSLPITHTQSKLLCENCNFKSNNKNKAFEVISIDRFVSNDNNTNILLEQKLRANKNKSSQSLINSAKKNIEHKSISFSNMPVSEIVCSIKSENYDSKKYSATDEIKTDKMFPTLTEKGYQMMNELEDELFMKGEKKATEISNKNDLKKENLGLYSEKQHFKDTPLSQEQFLENIKLPDKNTNIQKRVKTTKDNLGLLKVPQLQNPK